MQVAIVPNRREVGFSIPTCSAEIERQVWLSNSESQAVLLEMKVVLTGCEEHLEQPCYLEVCVGDDSASKRLCINGHNNSDLKIRTRNWRRF